MALPIQFRAHHFLCALGFQGMGYSPHFVRNFQNILEQLQKNPEQEIEVVKGQDAICNACPLETSAKTCQQQALIQQLDEAHAKILSLKNGQRFTWLEAKLLIKKQMTLADFHVACAKCEWKKYGVCEKALTALLNKEVQDVRHMGNNSTL